MKLQKYITTASAQTFCYRCLSRYVKIVMIDERDLSFQFAYYGGMFFDTLLVHV